MPVDNNQMSLSSAMAALNLTNLVDQSQVPKVLKQVLGKTIPFDQLQQALRQVKPASPDGYNPAELETVIQILGHGKVTSKPTDQLNSKPAAPAALATPVNSPAKPKSSPSSAGRSKLTRVGGATEGSQHTFDEEEVSQYILHILQVIPNVQHLDPQDPDSLFGQCRDGLLLAALINDAVPDTIDERVLNRPANNTFQQTENNNLVIGSAKAIGCRVVNIGSADLIEGREHLILGLIWQIIRTGLLSRINLHLHPELARLLEPGEELEAFLRLPAEAILLRWVNYHLSRSSCPQKRLTNLHTDVRDGEAYTLLLHQLAQTGLQGLSMDAAQRADLIVGNAERLGVGRYISAHAILSGHPRLNLAWIAHLFNRIPGLAALTEDERAKLDDQLFASQGDREARALCLWMNSLGVEPFVNSLLGDLRDGRILLQLFDAIRPGTVDWRRVNLQGDSRFKWLENCNYAVQLGLSWQFSLVGIQGADLTDGNATLTRALCWQLMRQHLIDTLAPLHQDRQLSEADIVEWANAKSELSITSLRDPSLADSRFLLSLLAALRSPSLVDMALYDGEDGIRNARYVLSVARKMGAVIFLLPEDIVEVKPRMLFTLLATLMALEQH